MTDHPGRLKIATAIAPALAGLRSGEIVVATAFQSRTAEQFSACQITTAALQGQKKSGRGVH
jgi:hypothetical protein